MKISQDIRKNYGSIDSIDITNIEEVRLALKSVFTNNKESFARFNDLFDSYWLNDGKQRHDHKALDPNNIMNPGKIF